MNFSSAISKETIISTPAWPLSRIPNQCKARPKIYIDGVLVAFYEVAPGASACYLRIAPWISSEMFDASWGFFGDREVTG
jgi:hypothetical protein